jgi:2-phospho-L-lactate transferase/gluconeogenesis factor (CofD/UPF0052 family)
MWSVRCPDFAFELLTASDLMTLWVSNLLNSRRQSADLIAKLMPSTNDRHVLVVDDAEAELYRVLVKGRSEV